MDFNWMNQRNRYDRENKEFYCFDESYPMIDRCKSQCNNCAVRERSLNNQ